ncbi:hypothetical protein FSP39_004240 [Pinctada imbricata]|uniref:Mutator-like transposase domain-containing protein n=1 Tax=Pinctada imbricata TaxID=66713 RepID=A0AA88YJQ1_PINIB|nr:hypothetical protein FSP39_004240 [Pinctada imbricata]
MEQDMVVDMVRKCHATGSKISTIIGDEDTSTISKLHKDVDQTIQKRSDKNHMKKTFTNKLFALQRSIGLKAISRHPFGDHSLCGDWCEHLKNPTRKYSCLPYGKCLKDKELQKSLDELLESYHPHCEKLADLGSSQSNESLNNTIASKAPKRLHRSGSSSLNIRVAAGIAQKKNLGHNYVSKVNLKAGLSPGEYTMKLAKLRDEQHRKRKAIAQTKEKKKRRLELKARR